MYGATRKSAGGFLTHTAKTAASESLREEGHKDDVYLIKLKYLSCHFVIRY